MTDRSAVIVRAGIAGLAAAIALHRRGWDVQVLERAPALREVGAGISLWPNATRVLDLLGVGEQVREFSAVEGAGGFRDQRGRWLFRSNLRTRFGDTLMLRRPILLDVLRSALPTGAIALGTTVSEVESSGDRVLFTQNGVRHSAGLLVGADGLRSTCHRSTSTPKSASWGRGERVGLFRLADGAIYAYLIAKTPPGTQYADDRVELHRRFGRWHAPIPAILDTVDEADILQHDIYRLPALRTYVKGRAVLVGDAAHAMTPDLGQGGGTALEDAIELADALDHYDRRRRPRTQAIARQSAAFGTFAQASGPLTAPLRNTAARLLPDPLFQRATQPMLTGRA